MQNKRLNIFYLKFPHRVPLGDDNTENIKLEEIVLKNHKFS